MSRDQGRIQNFFLGGGALVSCSTSTPINHSFFFGRIPVVLENRRSSQGKWGVHTPCTLPLDPSLEMLVQAKIPNWALQSHSCHSTLENLKCKMTNMTLTASLWASSSPGGIEWFLEKRDSWKFCPDLDISEAFVLVLKSCFQMIVHLEGSNCF